MKKLSDLPPMAEIVANTRECFEPPTDLVFTLTQEDSDKQEWAAENDDLTVAVTINKDGSHPFVVVKVKPGMHESTTEYHNEELLKDWAYGCVAGLLEDLGFEGVEVSEEELQRFEAQRKTGFCTLLFKTE